MKHYVACALVLMFCVLLGVDPAQLDGAVVNIPIANNGFEDKQLADGQFTRRPPPSGNPLEVITDDPIPGWVVIDGFGFDVGGTWNPPAESLTDQASEGQNVAYSNGAVISKELTTNLTGDTKYLLRVDIGNRADQTFPGYHVQLLANGALLAQDDSSLTPGSGQFLTSRVHFIAPANHDQLGQSLEVKMDSLSLQTVFDNVRLLAVPLSDLGDLDCDGDVDFDDIDDFVLGLNNPESYENVFGVPSELKGDMDGNGNHDFDDISGFLDVLVGSAAMEAHRVPEPPTVNILVAAISLLAIAAAQRQKCRLT